MRISVGKLSCCIFFNSIIYYGLILFFLFFCVYLFVCLCELILIGKRSEKEQFNFSFFVSFFCIYSYMLVFLIEKKKRKERTKDR